MNDETKLDLMLEKVKEFITSEFYTPMDMHDLGAMMALDVSEYDTFAEAVDELLMRGVIIETKRGKLIPAADSGLITGVFSATTRGFGFFRRDGESSDEVFIPRDKVNGAMHGDRVMIKLLKPQKGTDSEKGREGEIERVIERALTEISGTLKIIKEAPKKLPKGKKIRRAPATKMVVHPDDPHYTFVVDVLPAQANGAKDGDKVLVRLTKYPTGKSDSARPHAMGRVVRIFGQSDSREANYHSILHSAGIKTRFDEETLSEARSINEGCTVGDRLDLRDKVIFTIDGADAKDFDDAISIEREGDGYLLGVHIADVSHYVKRGTALDNEALCRGTSVYFVDKVVPMLPEKLSNGVCSLNVGTDKYTLSALLHFDAEGTLLETELRETVISSKLRGVYTEVNDVLASGESSEFYDKYAFLFPETLPTMVELYEKLLAKSRARGSLELETSEAIIILGEDGLPTSICPRERGVSERLIEQFMLAANEAVAAWLSSMSLPCIYRTHEEPSDEKVEAFKTFVHNLGLDIRPLNRRKLLPSCYRDVYDEALSRNMGAIVTPVMLRSLMKAKYSAAAAPHFGLSCELYCHFTSPIRRYPDLAVHRIVKKALHGEIGDGATSALEKFVIEAAEKSNEAELRAMNAEREIEDLYKTLYMSNKIGERFVGVISSVTSFGFFVELPDTCEGLVPIVSLDGWFEYDEKKRELSGGGITYSLGQSVRVKVVSCDVSARRVEFNLV